MRSQKGLKPGEKKERLRRQLKKKRDSITPSSRLQKSRGIAGNLRKLPVYSDAGTVMFYVNKGSEAETKSMIMSALRSGKRVAVPFVSNKNMGCACIKSLKELTKGAFGILEPRQVSRKEIDSREIDAVVVPAIAYDVSCRRIGYGGGYYDRWLKKVPEQCRIGIAFEDQIISKIPSCPNDVPVGVIVTEKRIIMKQGSKKKVFKSQKE